MRSFATFVSVLALSAAVVTLPVAALAQPAGTLVIADNETLWIGVEEGPR